MCENEYLNFLKKNYPHTSISKKQYRKHVIEIYNSTKSIIHLVEYIQDLLNSRHESQHQKLAEEYIFTLKRMLYHLGSNDMYTINILRRAQIEALIRFVVSRCSQTYSSAYKEIKEMSFKSLKEKLKQNHFDKKYEEFYLLITSLYSSLSRDVHGVTIAKSDRTPYVSDIRFDDTLEDILKIKNEFVTLRSKIYDYLLKDSINYDSLSTSDLSKLQNIIGEECYDIYICL